MTTPADAVEAFLHHLAVERGSAANTLRSYTGDLRRYVEHLAERGIGDLDAVREADVSGFVTALRNPAVGGPVPLAASSAARALAAVRGLHRFAARDGLVADDVAREVAPPALPAKLPRALTVDDVDQLLAGCIGSGPVPLRDRALLELLYSTGARISEAVGIDLRRSRRRRAHGAAARQGRQAADRARRPAGAGGRGRLPGAGPAGAVRARHAAPRRCCSTPGAAG